jgi:signal transduction histidine kinase
LGDSSGRLPEVVERRRLLERAVAAAPEILTTRDAVVAGGALLVARDEAKGVRSIRMAPWEESPAVERHELWTYQRAWSLAPPRDTGSEVAAEPIRLGGEGPLLGYVWTTGGMAFDVLQRLSQRSLGRIGAVAQAGVILLSCAALVLLLRRERQLARLREHLLANVSHELKSPVTSVRMFSELLGKPGLEPAEARGFARHLRRETARLGQLLENLLDLSHPERGESRLPAEPIDVAALLEEVGESFALRAREAGVEFRIECAGGEGAEGEGLVLVTNGPALERIVLNLLDNALKYRRAKDSRVILRLAASAGSASVSVEDNGPGVPARDRERIFEDFYRGRFEDFGVKGAGLGLSIARKLARQLGGDVRLIACSENGSTFLLTLPHRRASPAAGEAA